MKCKKCMEENRKSIIWVGMSTTTLMGIPPSYFDEDGNLCTPPDPNKTTTGYRCSNGHEWSETK